ncbi:type IV secretion protein Rhs [Enterobacter cloacae complex sp. 2022EL-00788]|uniref:type IV secretion protein Rhs n=1 Tax=Enterobacter cloacae complex sp. 2022EL-00788 TaxID=2996512 RepID=UPI00226F9CF4|nr:type IV secretion protein Rhs [Enterobacter cloacae complex sp. 2022EL-00788]MCY0773751.1 type IV secretion protein Rhs [Enterobacter cloacae complex sp. 2022EL-00788]
MTIHDKKKNADQKEEKEGTLRLLTSGEIALAKSVFRSTIPYHKVWIHHDSYLPFGLQDKNTAMSPNGEIYFRHWYRDDYASAVPFLQHLFIHEMSHVWQREKGMNVIGRGLISWAVSYRYVLDGRLLSEYPMEQQAQIIADHFSLQVEGYETWCDMRKAGDITLDGNMSEYVVRNLYSSTLRGFPW